MWQLHLHLIHKNKILYSQSTYNVCNNTEYKFNISPMNTKNVQYLYEPVLI